VSKIPRPRRAIALLAALGFHVLVAVLLTPKTAPPVDETQVVEVFLVRPPAVSTSLPARTRTSVRAPTPATAHGSKPSPAPAPSAKEAAPPPGIDWRVQPSSPVADRVREALRGKVGCQDADLLALTKAERRACQEALAKGAREARAYAVISPKLKKVFDGTFECPKDDVWCEYRIGKGPYPGLLARARKHDPSWD
jgi:hypothetical protein